MGALQLLWQPLHLLQCLLVIQQIFLQLPQVMAATPTPFTINVQQDAIDLLKQKLELATFPDELDDAGWAYGSPLSDIKRLTERWKSGYDWKTQEARFNKMLPQFTMDIEVDGGFGNLNIHFVHQKSERPDAIPLLFVHGWPGSFMEVSKILPLLVKPDSDDQPAFHVVAPSLPGFAFSSPPTKKGFRSAQYAEVFNKLMLALGYNKYVAQGGDWGSIITRKMAFVNGPKTLKSWHTNFPFGAPLTLESNPIAYIAYKLSTPTQAEQIGFERTKWYKTLGQGYLIEQGTQPQTIGYSLQDSPVGLLAWIYEKLVEWTDKYPWDDDEVLTWVSIHWFSKAGPAAALRIYYELQQSGDVDAVVAETPSIPNGVSYFPAEIRRDPIAWVKASANVVFSNEHESGGHFAAYEEPEALVGDLRKMYGKGGPAFGVVSRKMGY